MATTDKKRSLLTETPSAGVWRSEEEFKKDFQSPKNKQVLTDALAETKDSREKALLNAHNALVDAFGPRIDQLLKQECEAPKQHLTEDTTMVLTMDDLEKMLLDLGMELADDEMVKECRQRLDEAKLAPSSEKEKMYKDIHRKFWAYVQSLPNKSNTFISTPSDTDKAVKNFFSKGGLKGDVIQWISHEGSMIICSLISVADGNGAYISMRGLPEEDKKIIQNVTGNKVTTAFWASLDQYKNFECTADDGEVKKDFTFTLGNRVASIPPSEATGRASDVKIERKGKDILIGDKIKLEKNRIQNLVQQPDPTNNGANRGGFQARPKVSGRNAYEIRSDVLEMALDWAKTHGDKKLDTDDVLDIAEAFYSFVEHK